MASIMVGAVPATPLPLASYSHLASSQSKSLGISLSHSIPLPTLSTSSSSSASLPFVYCGRGDRKTERGKRFNHSFGNARPHGKKKGRGPPRIPVPPAPPKDDDEVGDVVKIEIDESLAWFSRLCF